MVPKKASIKSTRQSHSQDFFYPNNYLICTQFAQKKTLKIVHKNLQNLLRKMTKVVTLLHDYS